MRFRQKIVLSNKWGFTGLTRLEYKTKLENGTAVSDGANVKILRPKGLLEKSAMFQALERAA